MPESSSNGAGQVWFDVRFDFVQFFQPFPEFKIIFLSSNKFTIGLLIWLIQYVYIYIRYAVLRVQIKT